MRQLLYIGLLLATPMLIGMEKKAEPSRQKDSRFSKALQTPLLYLTDSQNEEHNLEAMLNACEKRLNAEKAGWGKTALQAGGAALAVYEGTGLIGKTEKGWKNHKTAITIGTGLTSVGVLGLLYPEKALELLQKAKIRANALIAKVRPTWAVPARDSLEDVTKSTTEAIQKTYVSTCDRVMRLLYQDAAVQPENADLKAQFESRVKKLKDALTTEQLDHAANVGKLMTELTTNREATTAQLLALRQCKDDLARVSASLKNFQEKTKVASKRTEFQKLLATAETALQTLDELAKQCETHQASLTPLLALHLTKLRQKSENPDDQSDSTSPRSGAGAGPDQVKPVVPEAANQPIVGGSTGAKPDQVNPIPESDAAKQTNV